MATATMCCYHCGKVLDLSTVPPEVLDEWRRDEPVNGVTYPGLCSTCAGDPEAPRPLGAIVCALCGRTTTDPDLWDPEVGTGRILCDRCWP